jgi:Fe-Mn family superoxide dismutase
MIQIRCQLQLAHSISGHINHALFWENLAPKKNGGGEPPSGNLKSSIDQTWGSFDSFKKRFNTYLAGIQGSGWAWLVKDQETGNLEIITRPVSIVFKVSSIGFAKLK